MSKKKWNLGRILSYRFKVQLTPTEFGWPVSVKESNKKDTGNENTNKQNGLLLHVSPTYNVLRHMYIVLPDDLAKGKRLVGGIVPVVTVVVVDPVVIVVAGVV